MAFTLTEQARIEADKTNKEPQIALEITGLDTVFSAVSLQKYIKIGQDELYIGDDWRIGGFSEVLDSSPYITFTRGTSTRIQQSIDQAKGETSTVSSMAITVIDKNSEVSALLQPDENETPVFDLLGRSCKVWLGFANSGWKEDFLVVFRGFIESYKASAGYITFNLSSVDKIIDSTILPKVEVELSASINSAVTTISLGPSGQMSQIIDMTVPVAYGSTTGVATYIRIDDEIILCDNITTTGMSGVTRGALNTTAASHSAGAAVETIYEIQGLPLDICKRILMGSEDTDPASNANRYIGPTTGLITNFVRIDAERTEPYGIYFQGINLVEEYGTTIGDFLSTNNTVNPENDVGSRIIDNIEILDDGSTIVYLDDSAELVEEVGASGVSLLVFAADSADWPFGLKLAPDLVDIEGINKLADRFFNSQYMSFYIKDDMNVREFLEQQLFKPLALYRVPRKGRFSVKYHFPPLPDEKIETLDLSNIVNPAELSIERSTSQNFYNSIVTRYNQNVLEDKFDAGYIAVNADSTERIPVGRKTLFIDAPGFRDDKTINGNNTAGATYAENASDRRLAKYQYGAEYIKGVKVNFKTGFTIDIGDLVNLNMAELKLSDIKSGTRSGEARLFEVENKTLNIQTGEISLDLVDTNFSLSARYALMSPGSWIKSGSSQTVFVIKPSERQTPQFGSNEWRKWSNKVGASVVVHNSDYSVSGVGVIQSVDNNTITLESALGFVPQANYRMGLSTFLTQEKVITNLYGFMNAGTTGTMGDSSAYYQMV